LLIFNFSAIKKTPDNEDGEYVPDGDDESSLGSDGIIVEKKDVLACQYEWPLLL
jgi:hypothetical protein